MFLLLQYNAKSQKVPETSCSEFQPLTVSVHHIHRTPIPLTPKESISPI